MIDLRKRPRSGFFHKSVPFLLVLFAFGFTSAAAADWPGQVDLSHDTRGTGIQDVNALAPQSNGRWIVAGDFYGSRYIARIDAEGNLDPLFLEPEGHDQVHSVAVQEDDKII